MNRRTILIIVAVIVIVIGAPIVWWLASPLFIDQTVDEAFPFEIPSAQEMAALSEEEKVAVIEEVVTAVADSTAVAALSDDQKKAMEGQIMEMAAEMPDKEMDDEMPESTADEWVIAAQGEFMDADSFHKGSGTATIFQQGETRVLRFENFESTNGPDLHVLLVENIDGTGNADIGEYLDLGSLKGNVGNQNYEIPDGTDLSQYSGVMIYCMPFHVIFSTASF